MSTGSFYGSLLEAKTKLLGRTNVNLHIKISGSFWNTFQEASYESSNFTLRKAIKKDCRKYDSKIPGIQ